MSETHLVVGDCTAEFAGQREATHRGQVVVIVKPDDTVLVHDADGYRPVAWLTRPAELTREDDPTTLTAQDGDQRLTVRVHEASIEGSYPTTEAGSPVGTCPNCGETLVRINGAVVCTAGCDRYGLPTGATVTDATCAACGLPQMRTERGAAFTLCIDRSCEPLDDRVSAAFDREWACPTCGDDLLVRRRGRLIAGCASYPDCDTGFAIPRGVETGKCGCGLPVFETGHGERCLDVTCGHP